MAKPAVTRGYFFSSFFGSGEGAEVVGDGVVLVPEGALVLGEVDAPFFDALSWPQAARANAAATASSSALFIHFL